MEKFNNNENEENEDFCYENYQNDESEEGKAFEFIDNLQQIVIEDEFSNLRNSFFEKYNKIFDSSKEENSLKAYEVFQDYVKSIEGFLSKELNKRISNLNMEEIVNYLVDHKDEELLDEELLEMLLSFNDFTVFKNMMNEYKTTKDNDLGMNLMVCSINEKDIKEGKNEIEIFSETHKGKN